jgi:predicted nucleic acid-binding protein
LVLGQHVLRELGKALRAKVRLSVARSAEILEFVSGEASQVVAQAEPVVVAKIDAADALVLGEALAGTAEVFVTGDARLLRLESVGGLKITSPRGFWDILHSGAG